MDERDLDVERIWLRQLLDALPVAVVVYGPTGEIRLANRARIELTGPDVATLDEAVSRLAPRLEDGSPIPPDDVPARRALRGETVTGVRIRMRTAEGRSAVMVANAAPLRGQRDEVLGAVLVFHDITQISELERGRRDLFTMANHDLRTPLTSILGYVQLARRHLTSDPERTLASLEAIERQVDRMVRLIRDLLDVARFETGAIPLAPVRVDVAAMVRAAVERQTGRERIALDLPDGPLEMEADPDRLDQVLDNLLANALRHTPEDAPVELSLRSEGGDVVLRVSDHGPGIASDEQARLFAPFYQTPRGRTFGGTGLGLHISRRIADAHGGRLVLERTTPSGSTFTLALPRRGRARSG